jgi:hypothetical protein
MEEQDGVRANAANLVAGYRAVRARLTNPENAVADPGIDLKRRPVSLPSPPLSEPAASTDSDTPSHRTPPKRDHDVVPGLREIVDAVAAAIGITSDQLMSDIACDRAVDGRKIAAALMVRRLPVAQADVAERFGIPEETVRAAVARVEPTLVARAIPRTADLAETVRRVVVDWEMQHALRPHVVDVKRAVCAEFGLSRTEIESERRTASIVRARQVAMALAQRLSVRSLLHIGRHFGGRDHGTVLYAVNKMRPFVEAAAASLPENATVEQWVCAVRAALAAGKEACVALDGEEHNPDSPLGRPSGSQ